MLKIAITAAIVFVLTTAIDRRIVLATGNQDYKGSSLLVLGISLPALLVSIGTFLGWLWSLDI